MSKDTGLFWWEKLPGKPGDLRNLLWSIAKTLGQTSPLGDIGRKKDYKPFKNIFLESKNSQSIFTSTMLGHILELIREYPNSEIHTQIVEIIVQSKFNIEKPNPFLMFDCGEHNTPSKCAGTGYGKCEGKGCFAEWLIKTLLHVEKDYWKIVNDSEHVLPKYECAEDEELVSSISEGIRNYEDNFSSCKKFLLDNTLELFNACIQCWNIKDVADENLAYIKWYTARLSTWPFFRASLQELELYDERVVYQLLKSASNILLNIQSTNNELWSNIEVDLLTSYISIASVSPFHLLHITHYSTTKNTIDAKMSQLKPELQIKLLPSLWMLFQLVEDATCNKIKQDLEGFDEKFVEANWLLYAEYNLYRYICDPELLEQTEKFLVGLQNTEEYRNGHNDTVQSLMYLYAYCHMNDYRIESCNRYARVVNTCGKLEVRYSYCRPSLYKRPLYDSTILGCFCDDRNKYLNG